MLLVVAIFGGCVPSAISITKTNKATDTDGGNSDVVVQKVDKDDVCDIIKGEKMLAPYNTGENELSFTAVGEGMAPLNTVSSTQALALAKRATTTDSYRQLASRLYGVRVNGKDTVKDAMLGSSTTTAQANGLIEDANIIDENFNQGLYRVNLELKVGAGKWKELSAY